LTWSDPITGDDKNREYAIYIYNKHIEKISKLVPTERLLKYKVTQGWEPLCHFLDVPIPSVPFPWLNDRRSFNIKTLFNNNEEGVLKKTLLHPSRLTEEKIKQVLISR